MAEAMRTKGWDGPPIDVVEHQGRYYVIDGHHRLAAAKRAGLETVPVRFDEFTPRPGSWGSLEELLNDSATVGPDRLRIR
jgi:uncharacterized ParB-like nuclease family protein